MNRIGSNRQASERSTKCGARRAVRVILVLFLATFALPVMAQTLSPQFDLSRSKDEIVRKLNRRISDMSTMPFNSSLVFGEGIEHTFGYTLNFEPVISFPMGPDWLALTRVEMPVVYKEQQSSGTSLGLGDTEVTLLFASKEPRKGWSWGFGQFWLAPTATREDLGQSKWGAGPATAIAHEDENWTIGTRLNHVWSFAGPGSNSLNDTFVNPWITRAWKGGVTMKLESESTYKWNSSEWDIPVELGASKLIMAGNQPLNIGGDVVYYAKRAPNAPTWGVRFTLNLVFPK